MKKIMLVFVSHGVGEINKDEVAEVFKAIKKVKIQGTGKSLRLA